MTNWALYNIALENRGNISLLFSPEIVKDWAPQPGARKRGGQMVYSNYAIELALTLRSLFSLTLRGTTGFLKGLAKLTGMELKVPNFSTLSRRGKNLDIAPRKWPKDEPLFFIVDSTGLKIYGEGEWMKEKHKTKRRKSWRKLHLGIDGKSKHILASELTDHLEADSKTAVKLIHQVEKEIDTFCADGAYDSSPLYEALKEHNKGKPPNILVPPQENAVPSTEGDSQRDKHIAYINEHGQDAWEMARGYSKQSLVENAMFRYKTLIGRKLRARELSNQKTESKIGVKLINWMTDLGMPVSVPVR